MKTTHSLGKGGSHRIATIWLVVLCAAASTAGAAERMTIRACTRPGAGFFTRDADRVPSGLEYDILKSFAEAAKADLVIDDAPSFDELLTRVEGGRCHIAAAGITVTEERKNRFVFSTPYFPNRVLVVDRTAGALSRPEDLKGKRVAVVAGTQLARLVGAVPGVEVVNVNDNDALFERVSKGQADALACDSAVVLHHLSTHPGFNMAFPLGERSVFAFALPKESTLVRALNDHLKTLSQNGEFKRILTRHFGEANAEFLASEIASQATARP